MAGIAAIVVIIQSERAAECRDYLGSVDPRRVTVKQLDCLDVLDPAPGQWRTFIAELGTGRVPVPLISVALFGLFLGFGAVTVGLLALVVRSLGAMSRVSYVRGIIVLLVILFALLVWPTPFMYYEGPGRQALIRVNRITGHAQYVVPAAPNR